MGRISYITKKRQGSHNTHTERGAGNKLRSFLEDLVAARMAKIIVEHVDGSIKVYSVANPPVAVISYYGITGSNDFINDLIGRKKDIEKFEETYNLNSGGFGKRIVQK